MDFKTKKKERELQRLKSWRHSKKDNKKILKFSSKLLSIAFVKLSSFVFVSCSVNGGWLLVQVIQILTVRLSLFRYVLLKYVKNIFFGMIFTEIFPIVWFVANFLTAIFQQS